MAHLKELTGMRGVAATLVVLFHGVFFYVIAGGAWPTGLSADILGIGWLGVDFFFVLSAFLLTLPLLGKNAPTSWTTYLAKRWLRIAPPYLAAILLSLLLAGNLGYLMAGSKDIILHALFLHPFTYDSFGSLNYAFWSLGVEFQFYLLLPVFILAARRPEWPGIVVGCLFVSVLWRVYAFHPDDVWKDFWMSNQLPGFLGHFALGIAAAQAYARQGGLPRLRSSVLAALGLGIVVAALLVLNPGQGPAWHPDLLDNAFLRPTIGVGFAALILGLAGSRNVAQRALSTPSVHKIGEFSYSLYLVHMPVGFALLPLLKPFIAYGFIPFVFVLTVVTLGAGWAYYAAVERPFMALKDIVIGTAKRAPTAPSTELYPTARLLSGGMTATATPSKDA